MLFLKLNFSFISASLDPIKSVGCIPDSPFYSEICYIVVTKSASSRDSHFQNINLPN